MTSRLVTLAIVATVLSAQSPPSQSGQTPVVRHSKQTTSPLYQRPQSANPYQPHDDFFHSSVKLVNKSDFDYGAWIEERRRALLEASLSNPFFWYSALTTGLVMLLMLMYGVRVLDEKQKLWRAAELLTDIWNQDQYSRAVAAAAVEKHNAHMAECNRVVEAQLSGRPSATALEAEDAKHLVESLRAELSAMESLKREAEAQVRSKEKYIGELSARVAALEKAWDENGSPQPGTGDAVAKLVARVNLLQQQLEAERKKNLQAKGA
jgi:hypothetical protein